MIEKKLSEEKVFKDPVHRYIHVRDEIIWRLIGTKEFQRLRRIRQLGTTYLVFHGAEHSRFQHSLGVYEVVRRIVDDVFKGRKEWDESERIVALTAALLHDVGHGPFSHAFEKVFQLNHEKFSQRIILGDTEVNRVLKEYDESLPTKVAEVIEKTYENRLVVSLISSQLDADRMDYLLRDAYYTGVSYGNFDMERVLRIMRPHAEQAVFKQSGMYAVEDYIMSRHQMYWQVYFHPVSRSAEVILTKTLHRAKELFYSGYQFKFQPTHFINFFSGKPSLEEYLRLDEGVANTYFQGWTEEEDDILRDLSFRFLNRRLFQYVDFNPLAELERWETLRGLFMEIGLNPDYYLLMDSSSDLPYQDYRKGETGERHPIVLVQPNGDLKELSEQSYLVAPLSEKKRTDHKVYYPMDILMDQAMHGDVKREILQILQQ